MKFETLMLQSLLAACMLLSVLTMGAMLTSHAVPTQVAASHAPVATLVSTAH
jgi:hypothetical protein